MIFCYLVGKNILYFGWWVLYFKVSRMWKFSERIVGWREKYFIIFVFILVERDGVCFFFWLYDVCC